MPVLQRILRAIADDRRVHIYRDRQLPPRDDALRPLDGAFDRKRESYIHLLVVREQISGNLRALNAAGSIAGRQGNRRCSGWHVARRNRVRVVTVVASARQQEDDQPPWAQLLQGEAS